MGDDLATIQISDLPLETPLGTVGVTARDQRSILVIAGRDSQFPPLTVNRLAVDVIGYYAPDPNQGGAWDTDRGHGYRLDVYRAGSWASATWNAYLKVRDALLPAVRAWVAHHPEVLAAAQYHDYRRQIAEKQGEVKRLFDDIVRKEREIAELIHLRDACRKQWSNGTA